MVGQVIVSLADEPPLAQPAHKLGDDDNDQSFDHDYSLTSRCDITKKDALTRDYHGFTMFHAPVRRARRLTF